MPNHIDNILSVWGAPESVSAFVAAARGRHPATGDTEGPNAEAGPRPVVPLNFHSLVPLPDDYSRNPYGNDSKRSGYELERETWGIKWGAYENQAEPEREPHVATYRFRTAWGAPDRVFMPKVAARFPDLVFFLSWGGEGPTRGRALFAGSRKKGGEEKYRKEDYDAVRPGAWDAYNAVQNARLATHPLWVGWAVAHLSGRTFAPVGCAPVLADWLQENGHERLAATVRALDPATDPGPTLIDPEGEYL